MFTELPVSSCQSAWASRSAGARWRLWPWSLTWSLSSKTCLRLLSLSCPSAWRRCRTPKRTTTRSERPSPARRSSLLLPSPFVSKRWRCCSSSVDRVPGGSRSLSVPYGQSCASASLPGTFLRSDLYFFLPLQPKQRCRKTKHAEVLAFPLFAVVNKPSDCIFPYDFKEAVTRKVSLDGFVLVPDSPVS